jgi:8-amino-7-oxononanoate synthase
MMNNYPQDASTPKILLDGEVYDYFCGCGYHDLQDSLELRQAVADSLNDLPFKCGAAHYGYGVNPIYEKFVQTAKNYFNTESILTYPSGYMGNTILLRVLDQHYDKIFVDEESHYSMKDALELAQKPVITFSHRNPEDLEKKIHFHLNPNQRPLVASDGVFPISGSIAPIPRYLEVIADIEGALIVIDDSHGTGVLGENGRGTYEHFGLNLPNLYFCGTMSKAFGSHGGIIPCSQHFIDNLTKGSNILKGSTEIPNPTLAASMRAMNILMNNPEMFENLKNNALYFKNGFRDLGFSVEINPSGMVCIGSFNNLKLEELFEFYKENHILPNFNADGSYTSVPKGGGINFTIFSNHLKSQFDKVLDVTRQFLESNS